MCISESRSTPCVRAHCNDTRMFSVCTDHRVWQEAYICLKGPKMANKMAMISSQMVCDTNIKKTCQTSFLPMTFLWENCQNNLRYQTYSSATLVWNHPIHLSLLFYFSCKPDQHMYIHYWPPRALTRTEVWTWRPITWHCTVQQMKMWHFLNEMFCVLKYEREWTQVHNF